MGGVVYGERIIVFTIGYCPLGSHITLKLKFKIPTPKSSEHMIQLTLVRGLNTFLRRVVYIAGIFFPSNTYFIVIITLITHCKAYFHVSSLSTISRLLEPRKASHSFPSLKQNRQESGCAALLIFFNTHRLTLFVKGHFWVTISKF